MRRKPWLKLLVNLFSRLSSGKQCRRSLLGRREATASREIKSTSRPTTVLSWPGGAVLARRNPIVLREHEQSRKWPTNNCHRDGTVPNWAVCVSESWGGRPRTWRAPVSSFELCTLSSPKLKGTGTGTWNGRTLSRHSPNKPAKRTNFWKFYGRAQATLNPRKLGKANGLGNGSGNGNGNGNGGGTVTHMQCKWDRLPPAFVFALFADFVASWKFRVQSLIC